MPKLETKTEQWPLERFNPDPQELARHDDPEETRLMGLDMLEKGQLQYVSAITDGRMIFGHGRWLAAQSAGIKTLEVKVYPAMDETQFMLTRASENLQRKELTGYRKWRLCDALIKLNGCDQQTLANKIHLDPSSVTRLLSPSKCSPDWQAALRDGKVSISDCYAASKLPEADQSGLLNLKLGGASRDALEQAGRRKRNGGDKPEPQDKAERIRIPLAVNTDEVTANGTVTVSSLPGEGIDLDSAEDLLHQALKALKDAKKRGITAKTFARAMKDMAGAS